MEAISQLSKPITKLIEVVASGIGTISRSHFIRKSADALAYEIKTISSAINESKASVGHIEYNSEGLIIISKDTDAIEVLPAGESDEIVLRRITYQQAKKQRNIENIIQRAAQDLSSVEEVSADPVDEDWIARFFSISEDISTEQMQQLWGRILAGEVSKPKSFSLRTLDVLKNITKNEADVVEKVALAVLSQDNRSFLYSHADGSSFLNDEFAISRTDLLLMIDLGIVSTTDIMAYSNLFPNAISPIVMQYGKWCIVVELEGEINFGFTVLPLSSVGHELLLLIDIQPKMSLVKKLAQSMKRTGLTVKYSTSYSINPDGSINYDNVQDIPE